MCVHSLAHKFQIHTSNSFGHFHLDEFNTVNSLTFFIKYIDKGNYYWESKPESKDRMGRRLLDFITHIFNIWKYIYTLITFIEFKNTHNGLWINKRISFFISKNRILKASKMKNKKGQSHLLPWKANTSQMKLGSWPYEEVQSTL